MSALRVFIATSLDSFIAGPNDEVDWLDGYEGVEDTFTPFFAEVGCLLMGRNTYAVASAFEGPWPYGETPVHVATHRPLEAKVPRVRAVEGSIHDLVKQAKQAAGGKDVYLDGGALIRSALEAGLVDQMIITLIPVILGSGIPLFAGLSQRQSLELVGVRAIGGGLSELEYRLPR